PALLVGRAPLVFELEAGRFASENLANPGGDVAVVGKAAPGGGVAHGEVIGAHAAAVVAAPAVLGCEAPPRAVDRDDAPALVEDRDAAPQCVHDRPGETLGLRERRLGPHLPGYVLDHGNILERLALGGTDQGRRHV